MLKKEIHRSLLESIGRERYKHSVGVAETARKLAELYGCDKNKAEIAGLLHDCGKFEDDELLLKRVNQFDIILDDVMKRNIALIHGPLGAEIAKEIYNISDEQILDSIRYHTTGRVNMSKLEKIIYLADYIEPSRVFPGVVELRKLAYTSLDKALLVAMNNTIKYVVNKGQLLHFNTVEARNFLLVQINSHK